MKILEWVGPEAPPTPRFQRGRKGAVEEVVYQARPYTADRVTAIIQDERLAEFLLSDKVVLYTGPINPAYLPDDDDSKAVDWDGLLEIVWQKASAKARNKILRERGTKDQQPKRAVPVPATESPPPSGKFRWLGAKSDDDVCVVASSHSGRDVPYAAAGREIIRDAKMTARMFDAMLTKKPAPAQ